MSANTKMKVSANTKMKVTDGAAVSTTSEYNEKSSELQRKAIMNKETENKTKQTLPKII